MPIQANVTNQQITASVGETQIDVSVSGGFGPSGAAGAAGQAASVTVGTVTTGAAGSQASVTNVGTSSAAVLNFTIPAGATGPQGATGPAGTTTWAGITDKPSFAAVATSGAYSDLTGTPAAYSLPTATGSVLGGVKIGSGISIDGNGVISASSGYTLPVATGSVLGGVKIGSGVTITDGVISVATNYAAASHSHAIADVTGLQAALDGKQASGSYAAASHSHAIADVTGLQTALDGKQPSGSYAATVHTHGISDVTGLQTALDGKASALHTHTAIQISDFASAVAAASPEEVVEFLTPANFPASGNSSLLYIATDSARAYRWVGSQYAEVGPTSLFMQGHTHAASEIVSGTIATARLGSGATATNFLRGDSTFADPTASLTYATTAQAQAGTSTATVANPQNVRESLLNWWTVPFASNTVANSATASASAGTPSVYVTHATTTTTNGTTVSSIGTPGHAYTLTGLHSGMATSAKNWAVPQSMWIRLARHTSAANSVLRVQWGEKASATGFAQINGRGIGIEIRDARLWILAHNGTTLTQFDTGIDTNGGQGNSAVPFDLLITSSGGTVSVAYSNAGTTLTASTTGGPTTLGTNTSFPTVELTNGASATACQYFVGSPRITYQ